ncbi:MAG: 50S ribosomal protein L29 [Bryobacterales bacterium]|nr:50S ribosomal protein L29 [Bryobacterales bacterium]MEB2363494.1 50S ribosomal protein L29 [Bryobacterales bacterium]
MRAEKVRELDSKELNIKLREMEDQLFRLKFQIGMGQADGLKKLRQIRKDRARMLTILHERELAGQGEDRRRKGAR